nr:NfeD family protein [Angustibacter aerolatus]
MSDHPALAWLGLALVLAAIEAATVDLLFLMLAGGALAGAGLAALGLPFAVQVVGAVVVGLLLVAFVRPVVRRRVQVTGHLTGTAALVGREARVLETVSDATGRVRLGGEVWSARVQDPSGSVVLPPGTRVHVVAIEGATAVVAADPELEKP